MSLTKKFLYTFVFICFFTNAWVQDSIPSKPNLKQKTTKIITHQDSSTDSITQKQLLKDTSNKQSVNSITSIDTTEVLNKDSITKANERLDSIRLAIFNVNKKIASDTSTYRSILYTDQLPFGKPPLFEIANNFNKRKSDVLFYTLLIIIFLVGFIKQSFPKYFQNLFTLFFQTSFRQSQTREQLLQDNLPSLLMNILFILSGGLYITILSNQQGWMNLSFLQMILYTTITLAIIYIIKYCFLIFSGWVFNIKEAINTYIFVVFLINKIVGVLLIPILMVLSFSIPPIVQITLTISIILFLHLLVYRYLTSINSVRTDLKVNPFHFFLYICAIEILPLCLIYKGLFNFISKTN